MDNSYVTYKVIYGFNSYNLKYATEKGLSTSKSNNLKNLFLITENQKQ